MKYFIDVLESGINYELVFEVAKDFRIGGLNPDNYDRFIERVRQLPDLIAKNTIKPPSKGIADFMALTDPGSAYRQRLFWIKRFLSDFNLKEVTEDEKNRIWKRVVRKITDSSQLCWHPEASPTNCTVDPQGNTKISSAHSIQRKGILKNISENNEVKQFRLNPYGGSNKFPIKFASTFYGFCDKHDKIFNPIENQNYTGASEQNFLFAYRAAIHSSHIKEVFNKYFNFGTQALEDRKTKKFIFNEAIRTKDYNRVKTDFLILDYAYPIAISSASDLDFDFELKEIPHSAHRMEQFFLTLFPQDNKTFVLFSYFKEDSALYGDIVNQIKNRNNVESDLSVLIAGHCHNAYFKPSYFDLHISQQENQINKLNRQTQYDFVPIDGEGNKLNPISLTPKEYLKNEFNIQLFFKH